MALRSPFPAALLALALCACSANAVPDGSEIQARAVFNVRDFGAVGNGRADDSAAIQKALTAAEAHQGGTVFFPAGVYSIVPAEGILFVASNITFAGVGRRSVIRVADGAGEYNLIFGQRPGRVRNVVFRDLRFDQNPSGNPSGINFTTNIENVIQLYSFERLTIDRVAFDPEPGVQTVVAAGRDHPVGLEIANCFFRFMRARSAYPYYDESTVYTESAHAHIFDNVFQTTNEQNAITALELHGGPDIVVERNRIVQFQTGMNLVNSTLGYPNVPATRFLVRDNDFHGVAIGVDLWSITGRTYRDTTIEHNSFEFSQHILYHDTWLGIEFQPGGRSQGLGGDFEGIAVDGNTFDFSPLHRQRIATLSSAAFHLEPDSEIRHFTARDNDLIDPPSSGIQIGKTAVANRFNGITFERNRIQAAGWDPRAPSDDRSAVVLGPASMNEVHVNSTIIVAPALRQGVFSFIAEPARGSRDVTLDHDHVIPPKVLAHRVSSIVQTEGTTF